MGHENDYNYALKRKRPRLTAANSPFDHSPDPPAIELPPEQKANGEAWDRRIRLALGLYTDGEAETHAKQETEREVAARLAALEALDPSQKRPTPRPSILNKVDYIDL